MKNLLKVLLVAFIILQFFRIDKTNPPVDKKMDFLTIKKTPFQINMIEIQDETFLKTLRNKLLWGEDRRN